MWIIIPLMSDYLQNSMW